MSNDYEDDYTEHVGTIAVKMPSPDSLPLLLGYGKNDDNTYVLELKVGNYKTEEHVKQHVDALAEIIKGYMEKLKQLNIIPVSPDE